MPGNWVKNRVKLYKFPAFVIYHNNVFKDGKNNYKRSMTLRIKQGQSKALDFQGDFFFFALNCYSFRMASAPPNQAC